MTDERINELRALCDAASPGPWRAYSCDDLPRSACAIRSAEFDAQRDGDGDVVRDTNRDECHHMMTRADAELIAAARTALPEALDEIERLRADVDEYEGHQK